MFELMPGLLVPEGPDDVRLEEDLDAELAALLTDPRARWTAADLEDLAAAAAAWPSEDPEAPVEALEGQINRLRCLLAAARADLEDAAAQHAVLRADRDAVLRREDAALEHRAAAVQERNAAHAEAQAAHAALSSALVDLALTRAEATLPEVYDPTTLTQHLHDTPPGPALATAVATAVTPGTLGRLPDDTLIELAAATGRITSWAAAAQLAAVAAYADRVAASPLAGDDHGDAVAIAELALACGVSRYAMAKTLTTAQVLPRDFPHLHHALATGGLDPAKARLVVEKTLCHGNSVLAAVEEGVLPVIVQITKPQLAELIDRLIAQADPAAHHERAAEARTERRVTFRPAGHGMATMNLFAAAEDVEAVRAVLNAATLAARQAQPDLPGRAHLEDPDRPNTPADPDGRHPAATRADTLIDLLLGTTPSSSPSTRTGPRRRHRPDPVLSPVRRRRHSPATCAATAPSRPNSPANSPPTAPGAAPPSTTGPTPPPTAPSSASAAAPTPPATSPQPPPAHSSTSATGAAASPDAANPPNAATSTTARPGAGAAPTAPPATATCIPCAATTTSSSNAASPPSPPPPARPSGPPPPDAPTPPTPNDYPAEPIPRRTARSVSEVTTGTSRPVTSPALPRRSSQTPVRPASRAPRASMSSSSPT